MPPMTPSSSSPGQPMGMLDHAPIATTTASYWLRNSSKDICSPMRKSFFISTPREAISSISASRTFFGRRYSGMPYRSMPPILGMESTTVTRLPFRDR